MRTVDVADYFGDGHPVPGGCNRMYAEMMRSLARVGRVVVDFSGVRSVPDTFLDATVGQVAYDCGSSFLRARMDIVGAPPGTEAAAYRAMRRADKRRERLELRRHPWKADPGLGARGIR